MRRTELSALALLALCLAACGLPRSGQVQRIDPDQVPYALSSTAAPADGQGSSGAVTGQARVYWLDSNQQVISVSVRLVTSGPSARLTESLELLSSGPTERQRGLGFGTALGPGVVITVMAITDRIADLELTAAVAAPSANRLPLAIGQVVLTATSNPDIDAVRFVRNGEPWAVPLVGGALTPGPLSRAQDADLLVAPERQEP
ncbi:MAG: GerMN domain-containing protein [Angustibacter sp.]